MLRPMPVQGNTNSLVITTGSTFNGSTFYGTGINQGGYIVSGTESMRVPDRVTVVQPPLSTRQRHLSVLKSISTAYRQSDEIDGRPNRIAAKCHPVACPGHVYPSTDNLLLAHACIHCGKEFVEGEDIDTPSPAPGLAVIKAGEIEAWRVWFAEKKTSKLYSINRAEWLPGVPMKGNPEAQSEGVHAGKTRAYVANMYGGNRNGGWHLSYPDMWLCIGRVSLWGRVAEHEWGYRAEYALPIEIVGLSIHDPSFLADLRARYTPVDGFPKEEEKSALDVALDLDLNVKAQEVYTLKTPPPAPNMSAMLSRLADKYKGVFEVRK